MKKLFIAVVAAFIGISANAQFYVGGQFGFTTNSDTDYTTFNILPEVGYSIADNMAVGAVVGYNTYATKDVRSHGTFVLQSYFRYTFLELGPVNIFADAQLQLGFWNDKVYVTDNTTNSTSGTDFGIGIAPGIAIPVSDNLSFVTHLGQLGYYNDTFMFGLNANNVLCGVYYSF